MNGAVKVIAPGPFVARHLLRHQYFGEPHVREAAATIQARPPRKPGRAHVSNDRLLTYHAIRALP
jgi:hypothetical protein